MDQLTNFSIINPLLSWPNYSLLIRLQTDLRGIGAQFTSLIHPPGTTVLKALKDRVHSSITNVQRYLSLGWIGFVDTLDEHNFEYNWQQKYWRDVWCEFHHILLQLKNVLVKSEKILALWEKQLYFLLLFISFSEFPNRLRPPCTTMPWTIWPALVVLWGVCWMFYDNLNWSWEKESFLSTTDDTIGLFESVDHVNDSTVFDHDFTFNTDTSMFIEPHLHMPSLEFQQQSLVPKPTATSGRALALNALMLPLAEEAGVNDPSITDPSTPNERTPALGVTPYGATSTSQRIAEIECPVILSTSSSHTQTRNKPAVSSRKSKHGQTERYFCTSSNCDRSQLGRGFNRKDHLTQHLRVHKSKKRSHESDGENGQPSRDSFLEELAEERRLRLLANQENCRLQQKLENYEERMQKYEDRLDRMMNLIESHRSKQTEEI